MEDAKPVPEGVSGLCPFCGARVTIVAVRSCCDVEGCEPRLLAGRPDCRREHDHPGQQHDLARWADDGGNVLPLRRIFSTE